MPTRQVGRRLRPVAIAFIVIAAAALLPAGGALAAERVALVVGNSVYEHVTKLKNPRNDATDVTDALKRLGFTVDLRFDLDRSGLWRAIREHAGRAADAEASVFFYAGHGVQTNRVPYLVPTDAPLADEDDLHAHAVKLDELLVPLRRTSGAALVFLDACRDDPFTGSGEGASRGLVAGSGVGSPSAPGGMLIAYATGDGETAADGRVRNSPFTAALLDHIETPGLEVRNVLLKVRQQLDAAKGKQLSETSDRLSREFFFKAAPPQEQVAALPPPAGAAPPPAATAAPHDQRPDFVLWKAIEATNNPALFELFLKQHPDSPIAPAAAGMLALLRAKDGPSAPPPAAPARPVPLPAPAKPRLATPPVAPQPPPPEERQQAALPPAAAPEEEERGLPRLPPADARSLHVAPGGVNLRKAASQKAAKVAHLPAGIRVTAAPAQGGWVEVWTGDDRHGFVSERFLLDPAAPVVAAIDPPPAKTVTRSVKPPSRAAGEAFRDCPECPEIVAVPSGAVTVGSPDDERGRDPDEGPRREVRIPRPLAVGRFEVTFAQWDACLADGGCGGHRPDDQDLGRGARPVVDVSHADALAYLDWLGRKTKRRYRLLGEAEWEYVARAGDDSGPNPWGEDDSSACRVANLHDETSRSRNNFFWDAARCSDGHAKTSPAGTFPANAFGLADLLGNVAEWTADCWAESPADLPADAAPLAAGGDCGRRALRGGDWHSDLEEVRYAARADAPADSRTSYDGFRVARDLDEGMRDGPPGRTTIAGND